MRISTRLRLAAWAPAIMAVVVAVVLLLSFRSMDVARMNGDIARQIRDSVTDLRNFSTSYAQFHEERPKEQFLAEHDSLTQLIAGARLRDREQQRFLDTVRLNSTSLKETFLRLVANHEQGVSQGSNGALLEVDELLEGQLRIKATAMDADASRLRKAVDDDMRSAQRSSLTLVLLFLVLATVPVTLVLLRMRGSFAASLAALTKGADTVGAGNLDYRMDMAARDEMGELAGCFNRMTERLQTVTASRDEVQKEVEERRRVEDALRESEERFRIMADGSPLIIWVSGADGGIQFVNRAYQDFFGVTLEEVRGPNWQPLVHPDDASAYTDAFFTSLKERRPFRAQARVRRADGAWRWVESYAAPRFSAPGEFLGMVGSSPDITEQKAAERAKDEFIGMVSHELRNPLTVVIGALSVAQSAGLAEDELQELLRDAATGAEDLADIIENLLELSRHQAGRLGLQREVSDVMRITQSVTDKLKSKSAIHCLTTDFPPGLPRALADPVRVERVLHNLVENAIKYSPKGGDVRVSAKHEDSRVVVAVSDQGIGIAPEAQARLFGSFERLNALESHGIGGLGLGLRVCRVLVEAHGGGIWLESTPGKGTTFYFSLPAAPAA